MTVSIGSEKGNRLLVLGVIDEPVYTIHEIVEIGHPHDPEKRHKDYQKWQQYRNCEPRELEFTRQVDQPDNDHTHSKFDQQLTPNSEAAVIIPPAEGAESQGADPKCHKDAVHPGDTQHEAH